MYHALYRKYRPRDFESVVGQDIIVKTLKNSIINNNFSHAYMFFGPRGTGKTTISKIFAKSINCLNNIEGCACGKCDMCNFSFSDECVDIIEIDAASNNGVDEIRELKNNINLVPAKLKYKVYIIDEVHMLSIGAFNALLKTLEEPPEHAIFILATTDQQKVPDTIVSRCQCFSFNRISNNDIVKRLDFVCKKEKLNVDKNVIEKIAILSDGGLRDALGMLDKLSSYTDDKITIDILNDLNGIISDDDIYKLISNIMNGQINEFLSKINEYNNCGKNIIQIIIQIINFLRDYIVNYYLYNTDLDFSVDLLQKFVNLLNEKLYDIKRSSIPKIYIEMVILEFINDNIFSLNSSSNYYNENTHSTNNNDDSNGSDISKKNDNEITVLNDSNMNNYNSDNNIDATDDGKLEEISLNNFSKNNIINLNEVIEARINNTFASASKMFLNKEKENFELLKDFSFDQEVGAVVNLLLDSNLRACGKNNFIISYDSPAVVEQNISNIININNIYNKITNSNKNIAIITDSKWNELKKEYISNISSGNKYEYVNEPELLFEEVQKNDIISSSAIDLFGSDIVEVE